MRGIVLRLRPAAHRRVAADMGKSRLLNRWLIIHLRGRGFVGVGRRSVVSGTPVFGGRLKYITQFVHRLENFSFISVCQKPLRIARRAATTIGLDRIVHYAEFIGETCATVAEADDRLPNFGVHHYLPGFPRATVIRRGAFCGHRACAILSQTALFLCSKLLWIEGLRRGYGKQEGPLRTRPLFPLTPASRETAGWQVLHIYRVESTGRNTAATP